MDNSVKWKCARRYLKMILLQVNEKYCVYNHNKRYIGEPTHNHDIEKYFSLLYCIG